MITGRKRKTLKLWTALIVILMSIFTGGLALIYWIVGGLRKHGS